MQNTPDRLTQARERLTFAKARWTASCEAALRGDPDAPRMTEEAMQELTDARREFHRATAPPPQGEWAVAAGISDEG
jgi:hypothetical protein